MFIREEFYKLGCTYDDNRPKAGNAGVQREVGRGLFRCRRAPMLLCLGVIEFAQIKGVVAIALLLPVALVACHKEEQAVVGVAQHAVNAEHQAQAAAQASATEKDSQRPPWRISLCYKSMYVTCMRWERG